jgi:HAD superfamily hydrolase (TIGR01509 family)
VTRVPARILFLDFDGVICDTEQAAQQSWRELYALHELAFPIAVWHRMLGRVDGESVAVAHLSAQLGRPLSRAELLWRRRRKQQLADRQAIRPGIAGLLDRAAQRQIPVAVVSGSSLPWVRGHLDRVGVRDRLAFLVTGEDAANHKPAPDLYLAALRRSGLTARAAVAVEDSPTGVAAARAAGLRCIAVAGAGPFAVDRERLAAASLVLDTVEAFDFDQHFPVEGG